MDDDLKVEFVRAEEVVRARQGHQDHHRGPAPRHTEKHSAAPAEAAERLLPPIMILDCIWSALLLQNQKTKPHCNTTKQEYFQLRIASIH